MRYELEEFQTDLLKMLEQKFEEGLNMKDEMYSRGYCKAIGEIEGYLLRRLVATLGPKQIAKAR